MNTTHVLLCTLGIAISVGNASAQTMMGAMHHPASAAAAMMSNGEPMRMKKPMLAKEKIMKKDELMKQQAMHPQGAMRAPSTGQSSAMGRGAP